MNYRIKSLMYFICFLASVIFYYNMDVEKEQNTPSKSVETPKKTKDTLKPEEHLVELHETLERT
ncbi:hypothetical protein DHD08_05015 [Arenibacter sp. H213]|uniref:Uncharacterized protein n=1 Tax=Arenibacter antarcticus TaxID=2040469 RepID=A0ABW5VHT1_9FLAO|nr:hypothetical protein [Arenibacter sp. H213]MCM4167042.1 hypothetical protein [Arenibacter sp. H213]